MVGVQCIAWLLLTSHAFAQNPAQNPPPPPTPPSAEPPGTPEPPKVWTGNASAGLALTSGNSDTSTVNLGYGVTYDPHLRNSVSSTGLFLRGKNEGELTSDRLDLNARDEYKLADGFFLFGQTQYLSDTFKDITYLIAPTGGIGYKPIHTPETTLAFDVGLGGVWEKNPGADVAASAALTIGDKFLHKVSTVATITQSFGALWKTEDFDDALYVLNVALSSTVTAKTQLKVELVDTFKNKPPSADIEKNDIAFLVALVYKY
jgi:putative salt-induced outer membrane protein YdiY